MAIILASIPMVTRIVCRWVQVWLVVVLLARAPGVWVLVDVEDRGDVVLEVSPIPLLQYSKNIQV